MVARSLRPEMAHRLAHGLEAKGETDQAIAVFQDLARLRRKSMEPLLSGPGAAESGTRPGGKAVLDAAINAALAAIKVGKLRPSHYVVLGRALAAPGAVRRGDRRLPYSTPSRAPIPTTHTSASGLP